MNQKKLVLGAVVILLILVGLWWQRSVNTEVLAQDTTVDGDFRVEAGKRLAFEKGTVLTVKGNLDIAGKIEGDEMGVAIVAGSVSMGRDAKINSEGNVQIVQSWEFLATTDEEVNKLYEEAGNASGTGIRVGPLSSDGEEVSRADSDSKTQSPKTASVSAKSSHNFSLIPKARAQGLPPIVISGKVVVATPPAGVRRIVVFYFPDNGNIEIKDFELEGPDGRDGQSSKGESCNAKGADGEDAFRFMAIADNLTVNNFTLKLGSGGRGGDAETTKDCDPGVATSGRGGKSGNFKMIAAQGFQITGSFVVVPGRGGNGGEATAYGKDGQGPGEKGGDATATGGRGADNKKALSIAGTVAGVANVQFASSYGGDGGDATADPGKGGDGKGCSSNGGPGGKGTATAGRGGDASLTVAGGASRTPEAEDRGGDGGDANSHGGYGGVGGSCGPDGPGGNGGNGGDAKSKLGKGGIGKTSNGNDGVVSDETGGNGGNGGDGCPEGQGGKGGAGNPPGKDGVPGKNLCVSPKTDTGTMTTPPQPPVTPPPTPPSTGSGSTPPASTTPPPGAGRPVQVIQYNGKYLPVDQLIVEDEAGCGATHYHAAEGAVLATDGSSVPDPGPQCGYGKVSQQPVITVQVPN